MRYIYRLRPWRFLYELVVTILFINWLGWPALLLIALISADLELTKK